MIASWVAVSATNKVVTEDYLATAISTAVPQVDNGLSIWADTKIELWGALHKDTLVDQLTFTYEQDASDWLTKTIYYQTPWIVWINTIDLVWWVNSTEFVVDSSYGLMQTVAAWWQNRVRTTTTSVDLWFTGASPLNIDWIPWIANQVLSSNWPSLPPTWKDVAVTCAPYFGSASAIPSTSTCQHYWLFATTSWTNNGYDSAIVWGNGNTNNANNSVIAWAYLSNNNWEFTIQSGQSNTNTTGADWSNQSGLANTLTGWATIQGGYNNQSSGNNNIQW
jgi:hypothetical protein